MEIDLCSTRASLWGSSSRVLSLYTNLSYYHMALDTYRKNLVLLLHNINLQKQIMKLVHNEVV